MHSTSQSTWHNGGPRAASPVTVTITPHIYRGSARVAFRFDARLVETLKAAVPSYSRKWDKDARAWILDDSAATLFVRAAARLGHPVVDLREPQVPQQRTASTSWADALFAAVGPERVDAVHRALTRVLHPDLATGSDELQRELNVARDRVAVAKVAA